jgi:uncharacterized protein (TIGR02444 family)
VVYGSAQLDGRSEYIMGNPFWDYSLAAYALDGVAVSCLTLQDSFGFDVNLLLYAAWLAHRDCRLDAAHVAGVEAVIADWRDHVITPLRTLRQQLQDYPQAVGVRDEIKKLELNAERQQQDMMYAFYRRHDHLPSTPRPLRENLVQVAQFTCPGGVEWEPSVETLVRRLPL